MKKLFLTVPVLLFSILTFSQSISYQIAGKVIDAATKLPLQGASVFAQNSTMGTATFAEGDFSFWLPNGGYDLAITFTGYETVTKRVSMNDTENKNLLFELKQKDKAMEEVSIKTSNEIKDGWQKQGDFFTEYFIGKTSNSKHCVLKNKEALKFYFSKKRNRLKVLAAEPLLIENMALGYVIKYTLDSFVYDYNTQVSTFTGYPLFEPMQPADAVQANLWQANRQVAYKGSILHFMRSVYQKKLSEEGFEIQFIIKNNNEEMAIPVKNMYGGINYNKDDSTQLVEIHPNQTEVAIIYKNEEPAMDYLEQHVESPKKFQLSVISIPATETIGIEQNGFYFDQNDIAITGYWSWEKVADMLPYDFKKELN